MKSQLPELSALLDGELEPHELPPILNAAARDDELRAAWQGYVLIGDHLRHASLGRHDVSLDVDLVAGVMAKIREEPVVLAPRNLVSTRSNHPLLALAASVAGVAVVGWLALVSSPGQTPTESKLAAVSPAPTFVRNEGSSPSHIESVAVTGSMRGEMSEYLLAHHTQASTFRLGNTAENIRTVSVTGRAARP